jgi:serine O-acetyltransferase
MQKLYSCFAPNPNKYYHKNGDVYFNPFQSAQYTIFLYLISREIFENTDSRLLADKIYYLNKTLNGCDIFYEVELPEYFTLDHPVGSVIGRARYGNGFSFSQCCTVGNNKGIYPILGDNVKMCAYSSIIGNCNIGNNVIIGANSGVKDIDIPDNTIVFGQSPNNILKKIK